MKLYSVNGMIGPLSVSPMKEFITVKPQLHLKRLIRMSVWRRIEGENGVFDAVPVYVTPKHKQPGIECVDLYFAEDAESGKCHYLWIRNLSSFVALKRGEHNHVCRECITPFKQQSERALLETVYRQ